MRKIVLSLLVALATVLPVLTVTTSADAATTHTWQRLANCESGGRWHINTGNGFYGGLQISGSTWRAYGGGRFARVANRATKGEQIRIAQRIKRHQGWNAWPSCSRAIGVN